MNKSLLHFITAVLFIFSIVAVGMPLTKSTAVGTGDLIQITTQCVSDPDQVQFTLTNAGADMDEDGNYTVTGIGAPAYNNGNPVPFNLKAGATTIILTRTLNAGIQISYLNFVDGQDDTFVTASATKDCSEGVTPVADPEFTPPATQQATPAATFVAVNSCGDGIYQATLIADAQLFWANNANSGSIYVLPTGKHVTIVEDPANGFVHIRWSCQLYYIRAETIGINGDAITKPFPPVK